VCFCKTGFVKGGEVKVKVEFSIEQAMKGQRRSRSIRVGIDVQLYE